MTIARRAVACIVPVLAASVAVAGASASTPGPTRPAAGVWHIDDGGGGFTVSRDQRSVTGLLLRHPGCGTGAMSVRGTLKLAVATRGGGSNWIIGRNTPSTSSGVTPVRVEVRQQGKTSTGTLSFVFAVGGFARDNLGDLTVGGCVVEFGASH